MMTGRFAAITTRTAAANSHLVRRQGSILHHRAFEKFDRIIKGVRLHILRQGKSDRPAQGRIGQHADRTRKRGEQLRGMNDPVEITRNRTEAIVRRNRSVAEVLHLLKHRIRISRDENVAGKKKHRQAIDVRQRRGSEEVGRSGSDRTRASHHAAPKVRLRVSNRRMSHCLFVVRAVSRQPVAILVKSLPECGDVSVAEDGEYSPEKRNDFIALRAFKSRAQSRKVAHESLRGRKPHRATFAGSWRL